MPQRPPQGRGSGGRVTPSTKKPASTSSPAPKPSSAKGKQARVLKASKPAGGRGRKATGTTDRSSSRDEPSRTRDEVSNEPDDAFDRAGPEPEDYDDTAAAPAATGWRALLAPSNPDQVPAKDRTRPWWGMGDVAIWGLVAFIVLPLFIAIPIGSLLTNMGYDLSWPAGEGARVGEAARQLALGQPIDITRSAADVPLWLYQLYIALPLWIGFVIGPVYVSYRKGLGFVRDWRVRMELVDIPMGLGIGILSQLVMVAVVYRIVFVFVPEQDASARARDLTDRATSPLMVVALIVMVGIITPIVEELFFRGLSHQAFKKRLGRWWGAIATSVFFAVTHGSYLLMPPLFLFAFILSWLVDRFDRLGPAVWAHIGFNLVTAVGLVWGIGTG